MWMYLLLGREKSIWTSAEALKSRCRNVYFYEQPVWRSLFNSAVAVPSGKALQAVYSRQPDLLHHLGELFGQSGGN